MKTKLILSLFLLLPTMLLAQLISNQSKTHYSNSAFSADFPTGTGVKTGIDPVALKSGGSTPLYQYWTEVDNDHISYMFMVADYPSGYITSLSEALEQSFQGAISTCTDRQSFSRTTGYIGDVLGNQAQFKCNDEKNKAFFAFRNAIVYINGTARLYQAIFVNQIDQDSSTAIAFFNSVQVVH